MESKIWQEPHKEIVSLPYKDYYSITNQLDCLARVYKELSSAGDVKIANKVLDKIEELVEKL